MSRAELKRAAEVIGAASHLSLACHVGPDGDALGSMLALAEGAETAGKKVVASYGSPFVPPENMGFLPLESLVPPGEFPEEPEVMVVLDVGSADRLGELAGNAAAAETVIVLDHHVTNEGFGDVAVVDPDAAATGEIVFDLFGLLGWDLTPSIATSLHTALVTDTGRFSYSNTTPRTLEIGSALLAAGARADLIGRHVYEEAPFGYLKLAALALGRAELDDELGVVSTIITQADLDEVGVDWGDIDGLIDIVRLAREADVAILAKAHADGRVKVSLRSRADTNVGALARENGGGGHRLAAGFTVEGSAGEVVAKLLSEIGDHR